MTLNQFEAFTISPSQRLGLKRFRDDLEGAGYIQLMAAYGSEEIRTSAQVFDLELMPADLRDLTRFLALGEALERGRIEELLSTEALATLASLSIINGGAHGEMGNLRLSVHHGLPFFHDRPSISPEGYFGNDSLALSRFIANARGRVLDLCCGPGAQSLVCAKSASHVTGVDLQPRVERLFLINATLNGFENRMEFISGDLCSPVGAQVFDIVCCNPPLLPVPRNLSLPVIADGGSDGLVVTRRVLEAAPACLAESGRLITIGTTFGNASAPNFDSLERVAAEAGLVLTVVVPFRARFRPGEPMFDALASTVSSHTECSFEAACSAYISLAQEYNADFLYSFMMLGTRSKGDRKGGILKTTHYVRGAKFWCI